MKSNNLSSRATADVHTHDKSVLLFNGDDDLENFFFYWNKEINVLILTATCGSKPTWKMKDKVERSSLNPFRAQGVNSALISGADANYLHKTEPEHIL